MNAVGTILAGFALGAGVVAANAYLTDRIFEARVERNDDAAGPYPVVPIVEAATARVERLDAELRATKLRVAQLETTVLELRHNMMTNDAVISIANAEGESEPAVPDRRIANAQQIAPTVQESVSRPRPDLSRPVAELNIDASTTDTQLDADTRGIDDGIGQDVVGLDQSPDTLPDVAEDEVGQEVEASVDDGSSDSTDTSFEAQLEVDRYLVEQDVFYRLGPGNGEPIGGVLSEGEVIEVTGHAGGWLQFKATEGHTAYVYQRYLSIF